MDSAKDNSLKEEVLDSVSTVGLRAVLVGLASTRGRVSEILKAAGLSRALIDDPEGRIDLAALGRFFYHAGLDLRDPLVGLHMAALIPFGSHQMSDYLLSSSPTLGEGINRFIKYYPILHQELRWSQQREGNRVLIELEVLDEGLYERHIIEYEVSLLLSRLRAACAKELPAVGVLFKHQAAANGELYIKTLGLGVQFERGSNAILIEAAALNFPCRESNSHLSDLLLRNAQDKLKHLPTLQGEVDPIIHKCDRYLREHLGDGLATVEELAKSLAMSPRTLQRKLSDMGLSFSEILQQTRHQVSLNLLTDPSLSLAEIAFLTGFSEASAFHRAFKKWSDKTPQQWRKEN